ncbi:MAG: FKBP-type peptidyl-prolyl cis-trans isomerase [Henriciella sp.]
MIRNTQFAIGAVSALCLTGCASLPEVSLPTNAGGIFGGGALPDCPELQAGPGPFAPPFPAECASMNKTASGVRYIPIANGDMAEGSPSADATIVVSYEAFLAADGRVIDSSYARGEPSVYDMNELIDGWAEAVSLMNPGDEWLVYVPSDQAFGDEPLGDLIPAQSDLVYRVKLDGFLSSQQVEQVAANRPAAPVAGAGPDMAAWQANFPWDANREGVETLPSGLSIVVLETGDPAGPTPSEDDQVRIHYEGRFADTSEYFDSSWATGGPAEHNAGGFVPGFSEALMMMRPGDRYLVHIPSELAYGEIGVIRLVPPNSDLMFQIELLDVLSAE